MCGVDCNVDHKLLRMKLVVGMKRVLKRQIWSGSSMRRWDVANLYRRYVIIKERKQ